MTAQRGMVWRGLASVSAGLAALVPLAAAAASPYGVGGYLSTRMNSGEMVTAAARLSEIGATWTRQEFIYENIGGANGSNFGADDEAADKTLAAGVKILGLLNFSSASPPSATDWERFVGNVVAHFASKVDAWEVLNEPNSAAAPARQMSPATYNDYLARSYGKIKQFDPSAPVVAGATAAADSAWLSELIGVGGCGNFDATSIHPYRTDRPENVRFGEGDFANYVGTVVAVLRRNCSGKKLWLTEFGYQSGSVGNDNQANWLARSFMLARIYPEVDVVMSYLLRDDQTGSWGVVDANFNQKTAFGRVHDAISNTGGASFSDEIVAVSRSQIEAFDSTDGWGQQFSVNASATLTTTTGVFGSGMEIAYQFNAGSAAAIATKEIPVQGQPTALGLFVYGDNSRAIWRLRFTDANGETFQALLGQAVSGWAYRQIDLSNTAAMTSWGGDGTIQYPIKFNSIVLDRDGGAASGTVKVDALVAVTGAADLRALKFGGVVAAWKAQGSATASVCGQSVSLSETPIYLSGQSGCGSNGIDGIASIAGSAGAAPPSGTGTSTKKKASPASVAPVQTPDLTKTLVLPDRWWAYATGRDKITISLAVRDTNNKDMTLGAWAVTGYRPSTQYAPPGNSTTTLSLAGTEAGLEELAVHLEGGLVLPNKLPIIWLDPAWQALPKFTDLPAAQIRQYDPARTADPKPGFTTAAGRPFGFRVVLPAPAPVFVYLAFTEFPLAIPLTAQADGSFAAVVPLPDYVGTSDVTIRTIGGNGALMKEYTVGFALTAAGPAVTNLARASHRRLWWYVSGSIAVLVGLLYLRRRLVRLWPGRRD